MIAYHGYWPNDLYSINSHFGTSDDLQALSAALHARGMVSRQLPYLFTNLTWKIVLDAGYYCWWHGLGWECLHCRLQHIQSIQWSEVFPRLQATLGGPHKWHLCSGCKSVIACYESIANPLSVLDGRQHHIASRSAKRGSGSPADAGHLGFAVSFELLQYVYTFPHLFNGFNNSYHF